MARSTEAATLAPPRRRPSLSSSSANSPSSRHPRLRHRLGDVREGVEGARAGQAAHAGQAVERLHDEVVARLEGLVHLRHAA